MRRTVPAVAGLLATTAVWGSTFVVTKSNLEQLEPASFLTWRFGLGAVALLVVRPQTLRRLAATDVRHSLLLGVTLAGGFLLQTTGLQRTLAGASGFLTGAAVVLTPVVAAVLFGERVGRRGWAAVAVASAGITLLAGGVVNPSAPGAALTLAGAACFAVHITCLSQWATRDNAYGLTTASVSVATVLSAAVALALHHAVTVPRTPAAWEAVLYLGLLATCLGFSVQAWAQASLTATTAAVVMTMEPVFAAVLALAVGESGLAPAGWIGGALVVASMALAELGPRGCCDAVVPRTVCC